jgi:hypothetical protein
VNVDLSVVDVHPKRPSQRRKAVHVAVAVAVHVHDDDEVNVNVL